MDHRPVQNINALSAKRTVRLRHVLTVPEAHALFESVRDRADYRDECG